MLQTLQGCLKHTYKKCCRTRISNKANFIIKMYKSYINYVLKLNYYKVFIVYADKYDKFETCSAHFEQL